MAIKGVMLDFVGVVVEYADVSAEVCKELGLDYKEYNEKRRACSQGDIHYGRFLRWLAGKSGRNKGEVADLMRRHYARLYKPKPGLEEIKKTKQRKVIVANNMKNALDPICRKLGLHGSFGLVFSSEVCARKPDPKIYKHALRILGTEPKETIYVGDEQEDLDGAKKLGIRTAFIPGLDRKAKADYQFSSLGELARFLNSGRAKQ